MPAPVNPSESLALATAAVSPAWRSARIGGTFSPATAAQNLRRDRSPTESASMRVNRSRRPFTAGKSNHGGRRVPLDGGLSLCPFRGQPYGSRIRHLDGKNWFVISVARQETRRQSHRHMTRSLAIYRLRCFGQLLGLNNVCPCHLRITSRTGAVADGELRCVRQPHCGAAIHDAEDHRRKDASSHS